MKRTVTLLAGIAVLLVLTLGPAVKQASANAGNTYYYNFEENVKPWLPVTDDGSSNFLIERQTGSNGCADMLGNSYASLKMAVSPKPKPINDIPLPIGGWTVASFPASAMNAVTVQWTARTPKYCESCMPMVYVGTDQPTRITQFQQMKRPLKENWQAYNYSTVVYVKGHEGAIYVAFGWTNLSGELDLDCVNIDILPLDTPPPPTDD